MYRNLAFLLTLTTLGFGFTACDQDPNSTTDSGNFIDQPMAAKGGGGTTTPADPKIVYSRFNYESSGYSIGVMDTSGGNQTTVYSTSNAISNANWSPGNSIVWNEYPTTSSSAIRAADISVSNGVPVSSNVRTIASLSTTAPNYHSIRNARWSSLSTTNKIAFSLNAAPAGGANHHVCLMSASGGTWDTIYSTPNDVQITGLAWNRDDTKLAVLLRMQDANSFVIISPIWYDGYREGDVIDSIPCSIQVNDWSQFDWSRWNPDINKLVFVGNNYNIYYLTARKGSTPTTNNVVANPVVTWSPNNTSVMFEGNGFYKGNRVKTLAKNTAQTGTVTTLDNNFYHLNAINWRR